MNPMLIGAGIGAATSLLGGSKQAGTTRVTQDLPDWLKGYTTRNLDMAGVYRDRLDGAGTPLLESSQDELFRTLSGSYLTPDANPYLKQYGDAVADTIGSRVDSRFALANRTGSFAHADTLSKSIGEALVPMYANAYGAERGRMFSGALSSPAYVGGSVDAEFAPFIDYAKLLPNLHSTETPFYRNRTGEILSGALAGAGIGNMFGGAERADPLANAGMGDLRLWGVA